jgi:hypothetical protein
MSTETKLKILLLPIVVACLCGCVKQNELAAIEVLNIGNCQGAVAGVQQLSYAQLAALRGSKLLGITTQATDESPELILLSVYKGPQPTPGYRFSLHDALLDGTTARLEFQWHTPDPQSVQAQMISSPCMVIGLEAGNFDAIQVQDSDGDILGELNI